MAKINPFSKDGNQKSKQGLSLTSKLIILFVILIILGAVIYGWIQVKHPGWIASEDGEGQPSSVPPPSGAEKSTIWGLLLWIGLGAVVFIVGVYIYRGIIRSHPTQEGEFHKIPVSPDRATILWKDHFCREYGIECRYDFNRHIDAYVPVSSSAINIKKKRPYSYPATGENFLALEVEIRSGTMQGIHVIVLPLDRGEKIIREGRYVLDTKVNRRGMPLSSPADKQDRIQMAMLDRLSQQGQDISPETMKSIMSSGGGAQSPPPFPVSQQYPESTGGDTFGDGEGGGEPQPYSSPYYPPPRRRTRRRYLDPRTGRYVYK